eukprot:12167008-Alexandrium_andersonii.AAC.1
MVPPGSAQGAAGKAALAALAAWPPHVIATVWKPFADWLESRVAATAAAAPVGCGWAAVVAAWCLEQAGI